jgi:hypothetical protein
MIDALVFACDGDWDLAWSLMPEEDYIEKQVESYDLETHLIVPGGVFGGRRVRGTLFFVKLQEDVLEVTAEGVRKQQKRAKPALATSPVKTTGRKPLSKQEVEALVKAYRVAPLLHMAEEDKRLIYAVQRLLYSGDRLVRWQAADVLGKVSALIARRDPGAISKLLQALLTSIRDTAASSWGALDAIGEIISQSPAQFSGYLPQLYSFAADRELLAEVLRALGKIALRSPDLIRKKAHRFIPLLKDPDPEIKGYTVVLLGNLGVREARNELTGLVQDSSGIKIYMEGRLEEQTVGQLALEALKKL